MKSHATRSHARYFSPSKADTWITCTASPKFVEKLGIKDKTTDAANEGTAAHMLLDASLTKGKHPSKFKGKTFNGFVADQEMVEKVGLVYEWCQKYVMDGYTLHAEQELEIACTGDKGTTDIALIKGDHLIIADLKYGKGYAVSAMKNRQMRLYACGTMDGHKLWNIIKRLTLVIWQPRISEEPQEWEDSIEGITHFRNRVGEIVSAINKDQTAFKAGEKQCKWCQARSQCKTYANFVAESVGAEFDALLEGKTPDCNALSLEERVSIFRNAKHFAAFVKDLSADLYNLALSGKKVPEMKLVEAGADRCWADEDQVVAALKRLKIPEDDYAPRKLLGLGKVSQLLPKSDREKFLTTHTTKPRGKPVLVDEDDPRSPYDEFSELNLSDL